MNFFDVLSQGNSRLHETSMSAMLGYLLDPRADHGLGDTFLRFFLNAIGESCFDENLSFIDAVITLESKYGGKSIDIDITIFSDKKSEPTHQIIIENKIKAGSVSSGQLSDYYTLVCEDKPVDQEELPIAVVFLTPDLDDKDLLDEYESLKTGEKDRKVWLTWVKNESDKKDIVSLIRKILEDERCGKINPINEYVKHTLKAFIRHLILKPGMKKPEKRDNDYSNRFRKARDQYNIVEEVNKLKSYMLLEKDFVFSEIDIKDARFTKIFYNIEDFRIEVGMSHNKKRGISIVVVPQKNDLAGKEALIRLCEKNAKFTSKNNGVYARHKDAERTVTEFDKVLARFEIIKKDIEETIK